MCDFGGAVEMEPVHAFLDETIGICNTLALAQMLRPRGYEESLDDASFVGGILEYPPAIGAVAAPFISELFNGLQELLPVLRTNAVFDRDKDWPSVVMDRVGRERCRPMHGGVRSTPAPACNFHRHVRGIAASTPPAARKCAAGNPRTAATLPQTALPTVRQPKNTVVYSASPRPRTQSGRETCADTARLGARAWTGAVHHGVL